MQIFSHQPLQMLLLKLLTVLLL